MRKFLLILILLAFNILQAFSQLVVNNGAPNNTAQHLIQNVLLGGGVSAFNITFIGDATAQMGVFNGGTTAVGLDSGIILSSGNVNELVPGGGFFPGPAINVGDPDLLTIVNDVLMLYGYTTQVTTMNDAAILEFDFVSNSDTVRFKYTFGSEEYPDYTQTPPFGGFIGDEYNDGFAFFLSGPGIVGPYSSPLNYPGGAINLATIPNSSPGIPITISSVHNGSNTAAATVGPLNANYFESNVVGANINGRTKDLEVIFTVNPCDTYHIKLAIADGEDRAHSSFVMLEAKSFISDGIEISATPSYNSAAGDTTLYEGCGSLDLSFTRFTGFGGSDTVLFSILGTATNGVDYSTIPNSIIFNPGDTTVSISTTLINDHITEGVETIIIEVINVPVCGASAPNQVTLYIQDPIPLTYNLANDTTLSCEVDSIQLNLQANGLAPLAYAWNYRNQNTAQIYAPTDSARVYMVTITDACNLDTIVDSVVVDLFTPPFVHNAPDDTIFCTTRFVDIYVEILQNNYNQITYLWSTGQVDSAIRVAPSNTTDYIVTISLPCANQVEVDTVTVVVENLPFTAIGSKDTINCTSDSVLGFVSIADGFVNGFTYRWINGWRDSTQFLLPDSTTFYQVEVTDACRWVKDTVQVEVYVINDPIVVNTNSPFLQCVGDKVTLSATPSGGYPPYRFQWSSGGTLPNEEVFPTGPTTYFVSITDTCGLNTTAVPVTVIMQQYPPFSMAPINNEEINCPGDTVILGPALPVGGSGRYLVSWDDFVSLSNELLVHPDTNGIYQVQAFDTCLKSTVSQFISVKIKEHEPLSVFIGNDTVLCEPAELKLNAVVNGGGGNNRFFWTDRTRDSIAGLAPEFDRVFGVTVTDDCDVPAFDVIKVEFILPTADFDYDYGVDNWIVFQNLSSSDAKSFRWEFGNGDTALVKHPEYEYPYFDNYFVTLVAKNEYGCTDTIERQIVPPLQYYIPNSFTPNGDGLNDVFKVVDIGFKYFKMVIYDRWGNLLFESNDPNQGWDGSYNGEKVALGTYAYSVEFQGFNQRLVEKTGSILVVY